MSGALNNVFGGGSIFGLVMNIASMAFPPLQIATSLSNLFTQTLGRALNAGIDILQQQFGLPKFVAEMAKNVVDKAVQVNQKVTDPQVDQFVADKAGANAEAWGTDFTQQFVDGVLDKMKSDAQKSGKKATAGSWLEAIALATADAMAAKAGKMIEQADKIQELSNQKIDEGDQNAQKKNAADLQYANAKLNAASKEFELLTNTMKSIVDTIGNALSQAARKG